MALIADPSGEERRASRRSVTTSLISRRGCGQRPRCRIARSTSWSSGSCAGCSSSTSSGSTRSSASESAVCRCGPGPSAAASSPGLSRSQRSIERQPQPMVVSRRPRSASSIAIRVDTGPPAREAFPVTAGRCPVRGSVSSGADLRERDRRPASPRTRAIRRSVRSYRRWFPLVRWAADQSTALLVEAECGLCDAAGPAESSPMVNSLAT